MSGLSPVHGKIGQRVPLSVRGVGVTAAIPEPTQAQRDGGPPTVERCSRCKNCKKCDRSKWGGKHCTHESGCCEEGGGNCNPTKALLNTDPYDKLLIDIDGEDVMTVRLAGNVFGTWACEDGSLVIAYMVGDEGTSQAGFRGGNGKAEGTLHVRGVPAQLSAGAGRWRSVITCSRRGLRPRPSRPQPCRLDRTTAARNVSLSPRRGLRNVFRGLCFRP